MNEGFTLARSIQFIKRLLNVGFWVGIGAFALIILIPLVAPNLTSESGFVFNGFVLSATNNTRTLTTIKYLIQIVNFGCGLLCLWLLRAIVYSITPDTPFVLKNAARIQLIAIVMLIQVYLSQGLNYLYVSQMNTAIVDSTLYLRPQFTFLPDGALLGVCLLLLAKVYRYGCTLQYEHDTTV